MAKRGDPFGVLKMGLEAGEDAELASAVRAEADAFLQELRAATTAKKGAAEPEKKFWAEREASFGDKAAKRAAAAASGDAPTKKAAKAAKGAKKASSIAKPAKVALKKPAAGKKVAAASSKSAVVAKPKKAKGGFAANDELWDD